MCGIVGYLGPKNGVEIVLEGLKRLEYRGYDSSGICYKTSDQSLVLFKKSGKLENLKKVIKDKDCNSNSCIGHTRWATHGEVNDTNAHPHLSETMTVDKNHSISIVHNGIIENAASLKKTLQQEGILFNSETDSEVFLGLLIKELKKTNDFILALKNSFGQIEGNSAFVILQKDTEDIFAIKRSAPLVCGINESTNEAFVSSDPYALAGKINKIFFPEDDVLCVLKKTGEINFLELDNTRSLRYSFSISDSTFEVSDKGKYDHYMLKEIHEQPRLIKKLVEFYLEGDGHIHLEKIKMEKEPERVHIVACGTAWHAGLIIKNFIESFNKIHCHIDFASEFRYRNPLIKSKDVGLFISQSGETADTLAAQNLCKEKGIKCFSIVNVEGSTLYRECDQNLLIHAGPEICVASTKAFTQMVITGYLASQYLLNMDVNKNKIIKKFNLLSERIEELLLMDQHIRDIAEQIYNRKGFIFTGRGIYYPVALEGALKLKEIAYVHAEGYAAGELKHGPIALIDEEMVNIAIVGPELYEKTVSNIQEVKARRGIIVILGPKENTGPRTLSDYYIPVDFNNLGDLAPAYVNVAIQLLAYYMAKFKGTDIDQPRNLAKSVTVE